MSTQYECIRCGHTWWPRRRWNWQTHTYERDKLPKRCADCRSPLWNTPFERYGWDHSAKERGVQLEEILKRRPDNMAITWLGPVSVHRPKTWGEWKRSFHAPAGVRIEEDQRTGRSEKDGSKLLTRGIHARRTRHTEKFSDRKTSHNGRRRRRSAVVR